MTNLLIKNAMVLLDGALKKQDVFCQNGKIRLNFDIQNDTNYQTMDATGQYLLPGFIDIHTHGAYHIDVNAAEAEDYSTLAKFFAAQGTTAFCASILTDTEEKTLYCLKQIKSAMIRQSGVRQDGAQLLGAHLEGPFLSVQYKGSMPEHLLKQADLPLFNRFYKAASDTIKYITIAPELEHALELIETVSDKVAVALGHSAADYKTAMAAIEKGARCITHTFNAMRLFHQHQPALMGAALESDVFCEAICDGLHLHPGAIRMLLKCKGWDKVVGITDSIMAAGLPDGQYKLGVNDVVVKNGDARLLKEDIRAGSTLRMKTALKNIMRFTGQDLAHASLLLSLNPAKVLRIDQTKGSIAENKDADLILLDQNYELQKTIVNGNLCYLNESEQMPA